MNIIIFGNQSLKVIDGLSIFWKYFNFACCQNRTVHEET